MLPIELEELTGEQQVGDDRDSRTRSVSTSIIAMEIIVDASTSCSSEIITALE